MGVSTIEKHDIEARLTAERHRNSLRLQGPENCTLNQGNSNIVDFDDLHDSHNPINWTLRKKVYTSLLYSLTSLTSVWASTAYAPGNQSIANEFNLSPTIALLGSCFLLAGWAFGPLIWAPLSELYGRKWPVLVPVFISTVMSFATATAKDIQTILITRFFNGFFGSAPITSTGAVFVDLWSPSQRGMAIVGYTFCVCGVPTLAPVVGGVIIYSGISWRWTEYITGILQAVVLFFDVIFIHESYVPVLLTRKAQALRRNTGNWALHSEWEEKEIIVKDLAVKYGLRPLQMLVTPICLCITIYTAFIYALYYASLESFPIIFQQTRNWDNLFGSLPYLALLLGVTLGVLLNMLSQSYYIAKSKANNFRAVPEARLPQMIIGSYALAVSLFIIGWTSTKSIHWIAPVTGIVLMGFGYYAVFTSAINYLVDTFQRWGASALAANTFARSGLAAALPLAIEPMFRALGNGWAYSVLGFFATVNILVPHVFYFYGHDIRRQGRYSSNVG
ncbi:major facilitator superfamily transporter multidrug resistance [Xylaria arbuscula]|nr:major facilitator superfamily transporter multidrug resistance [Xylaria arbuscula]